MFGVVKNDLEFVVVEIVSETEFVGGVLYSSLNQQHLEPLMFGSGNGEKTGVEVMRMVEGFETHLVAVFDADFH
jgi:hypothetical protein